MFGWEFGAGLGHLTRFKPIGDRLVADGAHVTLALQDIDKARPFLDGSTGRPLPGYSVVQAPRWNISGDPAIRKIPTHSFADVLNLIGIGQKGAMIHRLNAWQGLLQLAKPDLVIGDFAPTLTLAARGRVPSVVIGNGYTTPPQGQPMPPIRPWHEKLEPFSLDHEAQLLESINTVLSARGDARLEYLADMFHGDRTFVFTLPMVDPYARFRTIPTLPPFNLPRDISPKSWEERPAKSVFLYMPRTHPRAKDAIETLGRLDVVAEGYVSELPGTAVQEFSTPSLKLHATPRNFDEVIPNARLVIHHGGLSTAVACILAGTPQLILPWNLEHLVTARGVAAAGCAMVLPNDAFQEKIYTDGIARLSADRAMATHAKAVAARLDLGVPGSGVETVLAAVRELI
jgi:UDP:flavonoid glycosyltransferase YjiC (YdhE family)